MAKRKKETEPEIPVPAPEEPQAGTQPENDADSAPEYYDAENAGNGPGEDDGEDEDETAAADASLSADSANARLKEMMAQNFIEYASYVIKDRAIPDVDDGMKPVQRRILWAMDLSHDGTFHKVASVVGDTMKFHPHGDASIYGALVYLANKELFIEKQGNYGSIITGKAAAAARYIECRLSKLAIDVLFNRDITELIDSYDGRGVEPVVLPVKIPALLIMGTDGIAVGTNTKIMSHNFTEVLQAQIAYLKGEPFTLYPDFIQGGIMDVSKYDDGKGRLTVRAKLEIEGRDIVVREVPSTTTTAKLMDTIEAAVNKNKIKIASFHDYTAKDVDIHLTPIRGYEPQKALNALYAYTDCQVSISCNPMVICDNKPVCMGVSEILARNTEKLVQYLTWELQIESGVCLDKILARTLAQIFIEERIYKRIEKCKSREAMFSEVRKGLDEFKSEWLPVVRQLYENILNRPAVVPLDKDAKLRLEQLAEGIIPDSEVETLVAIPIRRIAAFEVDENREQIELLRQQLDQAAKNLKRIRQYTIRFLQGLIDKYGRLYPRRTVVCLDGFEKIDMHAVALNNIRVGWDKKNCYIGTQVKSEDVVVCSEVDHLLCIERSGEYKVINIPDKIYIDRLYEFRKYDKETQFGIVYSEKKTGRVYMKRTVISKFITDREYRIIPDGCRLEMITPRPNAIYEICIDTPIKARQVQEINLMDAPLRSPRAGGTPVSLRKLLKITFVRYLDENDATGEPELIPADPEPEDDPQAVSEASSSEPAAPEMQEPPKPPAQKPSAPRKKSARTPELKSGTGSGQEPKRKPAEPEAEAGDGSRAPEAKEQTGEKQQAENPEEENWGIQPDLGF